MRTIRERLEAVDKAIEALETVGVKSYNLGTYSVTKQDLASLYAERRELESELAASEGGGCFVGVFRRY